MPFPNQVWAGSSQGRFDWLEAKGDFAKFHNLLLEANPSAGSVRSTLLALFAHFAHLGTPYGHHTLLSKGEEIDLRTSLSGRRYGVYRAESNPHTVQLLTTAVSRIFNWSQRVSQWRPVIRVCLSLFAIKVKLIPN